GAGVPAEVVQFVAQIGQLGPDRVLTVVSRGGRPDLTGDALEHVRAPILLIVGDQDHEVLKLNEEAARRLRAPHSLYVVAGATHLFEEPGALEQVADTARRWCDERLRSRSEEAREQG
ncbi:alpha/beta hydrolase, partial [Streptomyces sp. NPDC004561]